MAASFTSLDLTKHNMLNQKSNSLDQQLSWPCILCTYLNVWNAFRCELCLTTKPIIRNTTTSKRKNIIKPSKTSSMLNITNTAIPKPPPQSKSTSLSIPKPPKRPQRSKSISKLELSNTKKKKKSFTPKPKTKNKKSHRKQSRSMIRNASFSYNNKKRSKSKTRTLSNFFLTPKHNDNKLPQDNLAEIIANNIPNPPQQIRFHPPPVKTFKMSQSVTSLANSPSVSPSISPCASPRSLSISSQKSTTKSPKSRFLFTTLNKKFNISLPRQIMLYKLPAEEHKINEKNVNSVSKAKAKNCLTDHAGTTSMPTNFSFASSLYAELHNVLGINLKHKNRNKCLPALKMYEESVQKHESILLEIMKHNHNKSDFTDDVIDTIINARCDVLCHFLPLIAFTLCQNDIIDWRMKLLNKLRDRIVGQSDLRQAVWFLLQSYDDIDCVQSVFGGISFGHINASDFWYELLYSKKIKENDSFIVPCNRILRDPVKQLLSPIHHVCIRKVINSNSKPLLLSCFALNDMKLSTFILKCGDDLRKDKSCMLVFKWINHLFRNTSKLNGVKILTYNVIPMSKDIGAIELITDCIPLRDILSLRDDIYAYPNGADKLLNNLIYSAAGSYIASYIMGVRDRHFDNILIRTTDCTLFHIDMNYVLGDTITGLDANKFGITKKFYEILGKNKYEKFIELACNAFIELRHHHKELINFACLAFSYIYPYKIIRKHMRKQLRIDESDLKSMQWLKEQLKNAPFNKQTKLKNVIHKFATR